MLLTARYRRKRFYDVYRLCSIFLCSLSFFFQEGILTATGFKGARSLAFAPLIHTAYPLQTIRGTLYPKIKGQAGVSYGLRQFWESGSLADECRQWDRQIFAYPTENSLFRHILSDPDIRLSFVRTFARNPHIKRVTPLSSSLSPVKNFGVLRKFLNSRKMKSFTSKWHTDPNAYALCQRTEKGLNEVPLATHVMKGLMSSLKDIRSAVTPPENAVMDFLCEVEIDQGANKKPLRRKMIAEVQVIPESREDRRALAYASLYYGHQLYRRVERKNLLPVVAINLLGGGIKDIDHWYDENIYCWSDSPNEWVRHYAFRTDKGASIGGIELYQYSLVPGQNLSCANDAEREWLDFFRAAPCKGMGVVTILKTPEVKKAYIKSEINTLSEGILLKYLSSLRAFQFSEE